MKSKHLKIKDRVILIGYDVDGNCIYSEELNWEEYYDGEHIWDRGEKVKKMKLHKMKGYLFDSAGQLDQEFESLFNLKTGIYMSGHARFADGTIHKDRFVDGKIRKD